MPANYKLPLKRLLQPLKKTLPAIPARFAGEAPNGFRPTLLPGDVLCPVAGPPKISFIKLIKCIAKHIVKPPAGIFRILKNPGGTIFKLI